MNLFELFVKIGVDDQASNKLSTVTDKLGNGLKTAAKVGTAAVTAASAGIVALTSSAIKNYAEYEQLIGGVETLFKGSADTVQKYAEGAYKTAGLSANEYMSTVTSFSASLLQSLGGDTEAAAEYANMAVSDMSDNANKMGTDMELIQNAYQGFAKQNYTMLDNLKLGYGGTKGEMQRLVADAAKVDSSIDANSLSFGNVVAAINVVQKEMGIYGTTALEAEKTISGSLNATKSAWSNLVTGIADDNADFQTLIDNFVESAGIALGNILPRVEIALGGISSLIETLFPIIMERIPQIASENLPKIVSAGISVIQSLVSGISNNLPMIVSSALTVMTMLINSILTMLPEVIQLGLDLIVSLALGIANYLPELIPTIVSVVLKIVEVLTNSDNLGKIIGAAVSLIIALAEGLIGALPNLVKAAPKVVISLNKAIIENLPKLANAPIRLVQAIANGIIGALGNLASAAKNIVVKIAGEIGDNLSRIVTKGREIVSSVKDGIFEKIGNATSWGKDLIDNFIGGIKSKWDALKNTVGQTAQSIKDYLGFSEPEKGPLSNFHTYAPDMMDLFIKGIKDNEKKLTDQIDKTFDFGERIINGKVGLSTSGTGFGRNRGGVSVVQNIYSQVKTAADLMEEALYQQEKAVFLNV